MGSFHRSFNVDEKPLSKLELGLCKNEGCENKRRDKSAYCQDCSNKVNNILNHTKNMDEDKTLDQSVEENASSEEQGSADSVEETVSEAETGTDEVDSEDEEDESEDGEEEAA